MRKDADRREDQRPDGQGRPHVCHRIKSHPRKRESSYIELEVKLDRKPPEALPLTLILALPRPPMLKRILFSAAMLGVKKIIILNFNRVEKSLWNSSSLKPQAITEQLVLGLEQAKDTMMPEVILKKRFKPFVQDELPALIKGKLALVAHPDKGSKSLPDKTSMSFPRKRESIISNSLFRMFLSRSL